MDDFEDIDVQITLLPGVDLALWTRIVVVLVAVVAIATVVFLSL